MESFKKTHEITTLKCLHILQLAFQEESNWHGDISREPQSHSKGKGTAWKLSRVVWVTPVSTGRWMSNNVYWHRDPGQRSIGCILNIRKTGQPLLKCDWRGKEREQRSIIGIKSHKNDSLGFMWKPLCGWAVGLGARKESGNELIAFFFLHVAACCCWKSRSGIQHFLVLNKTDSSSGINNRLLLISTFKFETWY